MTRHELLRRFPNASESFIKANSDPVIEDSRKDAVMECHPSHGALGQVQVEEADTGRVHIRIVSVRKRLIDPDNLAAKWHIDSLRYARIIRGDEPDKITLEITQRKAAKGEEEHTQIDIWQI